MATTWIVAADSSRARILQVAGRLHERELTTDATDVEEPGAVDHAVEMFSKRIGGYLEKARTDRRYDQLVLVAPPKFLGLMRRELCKEVEKLVLDEVPKDLAWLNAREIEKYFAKGSARAP
jgi:protein required for attachment to host cells